MLARDPPSLMKKLRLGEFGRIMTHHCKNSARITILNPLGTPFTPPLKRSTGSIILLAKEALVKPLISRFCFVSISGGRVIEKNRSQIPCEYLFLSLCGDQFWGNSSLKSLVCNSVQGVPRSPGGLSQGFLNTGVCVCVCPTSNSLASGNHQPPPKSGCL